MTRKVRLSACCMNQWSLDFAGNLERILQSIRKAKEAGSRLRLGSELEICGYGCADHLLEPDTTTHSWEVVAEILQRSKDDLSDIIIVVGMPVFYKNTAYNCLIALLNGKIELIRPKMAMCDDDNYRESRWFVSWRKQRTLEQFLLPDVITDVNKQRFCPIGDGVIQMGDGVTVGFEICEELWTAKGSYLDMSLSGVDIILNASGSHHVLRKSNKRLNRLILGATEKNGGIYLFSNQRGCDGDRLYYDGSATIAQNGSIYAQGAQFELAETEVISATLDVERVDSYRNRIRSSRVESTRSESYPYVQIDFRVCLDELEALKTPLTEPLTITMPTVEEEIASGPPAWMWDYLRRSKQSGFFLPLSGGRDSAAVACMVSCMCRMVINALHSGDKQAYHDVNYLFGNSLDDAAIKRLTHDQLCGHILFTCYLGTQNSSKETKERAGALATQIGASHSSVLIDTAVSAVIKIFEIATGGRLPRFRVEGGEGRENLALQNIQARLRMVISYLFAQLSLWAKGRPGGLLVLGTANVDECLRGYLTKYDCSSADINPIGGICKGDLNGFLQYCLSKFGLDSLTGILDAPPTAELEPLQDGQLVQTDEADMGMTYEELGVFGRLRLPGSCGPYSMFIALLDKWGHKHSPHEIAAKVKHFFRCYAINRHKATVLTPAYHAEHYSPDDHRHDHRPFLYNVDWPWQFKRIDRTLELLEKSGLCTNATQS
uniref:Glutamine-dependent NAD(+) synthetase n=1 Tax=Plectus sambesii TaxID=2011161 RepID=A0A914WZ17_9BILA